LSAHELLDGTDGSRSLGSRSLEVAQLRQASAARVLVYSLYCL